MSGVLPDDLLEPDFEQSPARSDYHHLVVTPVSIESNIH